MNVVCVRQGNKYGREYVAALRRMVAEHVGAELICLGDDRPIKSYTGWWSKLELFAPWNADLRPCLYFDLDTYLLGDCRDMLVDTGELWLIRDFHKPQRANSGVMILPADTDAIWQAHFKWDEYRVDGDFLTTQPHRILQDRFAGIVSYKVHCLHNPQGRVVCFHGVPKPHQLTSGWGKQIWERYNDGTPAG